MNLIYTFDININKDNKSKLDIIKSYYINSIKSAKKLGYFTEIYTNCNEFDNYVDKKHIVKSDYDLVFWDRLKLIPLDTTDGLLVDGDIIFHNILPTLDDNIDMYFDAWESYIPEYSDAINELTSLGIGDIIPEWDTGPQRFVNIGILKINNIELKKLWVDRWWKLYNFYLENKFKLKNDSIYGTIASQYLLSLVSKKFKIKNLSNLLGKNNGYYTHFVGQQKYRNNPLPISTIII